MLLAVAVAMSPQSIAPLTDEQRDRLSLANDGGDHQEEAFLALLENVRQWRESTTESPTADAVDAAMLLTDPSSYRGELFVVKGVLQQQSPLGPGFENVFEWFIRDDNGRAQLMYLVDSSKAQWRDGQRIEVPARFYKVVQMVARNGSVQQYPAFVGAFPKLAQSPSITSDVGSRWLLAIPIAALVVAYFILSRWVRRTKRVAFSQRIGRWRQPPADAPVDDDAHLPDDPAAALAELKRRAAENT